MEQSILYTRLIGLSGPLCKGYATQRPNRSAGRPPLQWYPCAHYSAFFFLGPMTDQAARLFLHSVPA